MPKKDFTSFDISIVVHELKSAILNSRVNNVYQIAEKTLLFKLHKADAPPKQLIMDAGKRCHLTFYELEKPQTPPAFCMALRKYLRGAWLISVEQHEFERIILFSFRNRTTTLRLILELFGDGNIILTDESGMILHALVFKRMRDRAILRNEVYKFPPSTGKNPFKITKEDLSGMLITFGNTEVVKALARLLGIGGVYAEEILLRANIDKTKPCAILSAAEIDAIFDCLQGLLSALSNFIIEPNIVLAEDNSFIDVTPLRLKRYEPFRIQRYNSFNEALDEFYVRTVATEKATSSVELDSLKREADKLKHVIAEQEQALRDTQNKMEHDKKIGELIYKHAADLQVLLNNFSSAKSSGKDWNAIAEEVSAAKKHGKKPEALIESFDMNKFAVNLCIENLRFSLNLRKTLFENAAEFFERAKKAKQKISGALAAAEETRQKLAKVEEKIREAETLRQTKPAEMLKQLTKSRIKEKPWYYKFRWFISSDGFLVVGGKDAVSNEILIKKYATAADLVFHAELTGASFVIVKTEGKQPPEQTIREAAEFAAAFSRAWREELVAADIYWVRPEQLSKSGPSGEYVPHGAFFVVGKRNWLHNVPLRMAVGVIDDGEVRFVGGAVDAVKPKAKVYVVIIPGDVTGKELLSQVLRALIAKLPKELREKMGKVSIEQIREFVPYAKGRIIVT
ncbi:MAG: ribosome rescue protein RqcH [Candidatus Bathyarchaeia archaeon]